MRKDSTCQWFSQLTAKEILSKSLLSSLPTPVLQSLALLTTHGQGQGLVGWRVSLSPLLCCVDPSKEKSRKCASPLPSIASRNPQDAHRSASHPGSLTTLASLSQRRKTHVSMMGGWIFQVHSLTPTSRSSSCRPGSPCGQRLGFVQWLIPPERRFFYRLLETATETSKALYRVLPLSLHHVWPIAQHASPHFPSLHTLMQFPLPSETELKGSRPSRFFSFGFFFL